MNNLEKLSQGIVHERTLAGIATSDTFIEGLNIGINRGYNLGHDEGYDDGFDQGYNDARSVAALLEAAGLEVARGRIARNTGEAVRLAAEVKSKADRRGRNPQTGEEITINYNGDLDDKAPVGFKIVR